MRRSSFGVARDFVSALIERLSQSGISAAPFSHSETMRASTRSSSASIGTLYPRATRWRRIS
jgi:hypothetical protein